MVPCAILHGALCYHQGEVMPIKLTLPVATEIYGCFYCFNIFRKDEIHTFHDNGKTPECPCCGIDSVKPYSTCMGIGDILIDLKDMSKLAWAITEGR